VSPILTTGGQQHLQKARAVIVSANGAETPRLLRLSSSGRFPQGLANSSGLVGKHLMVNGNGGTMATFEHPLNDYTSAAVSRVLHDFYGIDPKLGFFYGGGDWTHALGGLPLISRSVPYPPRFRAGARLTRTGWPKPSRTRCL
jgi:choline dehydrogenase-like flavoprotein